MNKIYYAVVYTKEDLTGKRGTLTDWLVKEASIARVCDASQNGAKKAVLSWKCLACQENRALLEVELETGRFHQIRVQMASRGLPLYGDRKYNPDGKILPAYRNIGLYSHLLGFSHPVTGKWMEYQASPESGIFLEMIE